MVSNGILWAVGRTDKVYALVFGPDGSLYVGECFTAAGGAATIRARWDGTQWYPPEVRGMNAAVTALAFGPDGLLLRWGFAASAPTLPVGTAAGRRWATG